MNTVLKIGLQTDKRMITICEYLKILETVNELDIGLSTNKQAKFYDYTHTNVFYHNYFALMAFN